MLKTFLLVGFGGAMGSICRFAMTLAANKLSLPILWATLVCNILGCLFIGFLISFFVKTENLELRFLLITGFCGGFTTFSAFSSETLTLYQNGQTLWALTYSIGITVIGILAVYIGLKLTK